MHPFPRPWFGIVILAAGLPVVQAQPHSPAGYRHTWSDAGATFRQGAPGNSGHNLYLNRRGELETIRRHDLDQNGHLDLVFNSTHDTYNALPATLARAATGRTVQTADLAVDGSSRVVAADLNRDGFTDLVFQPNRQNVQQQRSSMMIAWGGADGWNSRRLIRQLPVNDVTDSAVGDLNNDGWPDIITLNGDGWLYGQPPGRILRTYWGGPGGFILTNYQDVGIPGAVAVVVGAFGPGKEFRAAVLTSAGSIRLLTAGAKGEGLQPARVIELPAAEAGAARPKPQCMIALPANDPAGDHLLVGTDGPVLYEVDPTGPGPVARSIKAAPATHLAAGLLDDDPWTDIVLTNLKLVFPGDNRPTDAAPPVTILWGTAEGINAERRASLSIPNTASTAIGDLDGDGHRDLLVAVYQGAQSTNASSLIFFGNGSRQLPATGTAIATDGASNVTMARPTPASAPVAIFANSQHRTLDDAVPLRLYWGAESGFSAMASIDIPNLSGYKSSASDLNGDGFVDLIVINGADVTEETAARAPYSGVNIYWGGADGSMQGPGPTRFDPARRQVLHEKHLGSINVADLNSDGYLDLVLGAFESLEKPDTDLVIYHGAAGGFTRENRQALRGPGRSIGCLIADFNRDGHLDIVVGSYTTNKVLTYWGSPSGCSEEHRTILPYPAPIDLEAADLNNDGWLDLLVASYEDSVAHHHDTGLTIFWGRTEGWHQSDAQWLPGITPVGLAVADLDSDGWLDVVSPNYHGELSREYLPSYIFWGDRGGFTPLRRTALTINSASEAVIADFNRDGRLDLAFCAHSTDPGHLYVKSPIFFNDGHRFEAPAVQYLPAVGPHYMWVQDIGNIYDRRYRESFTSRIFSWADTVHEGRLTADATRPFGARLEFQIRSAPDAASLTGAAWRKVGDESFAVGADDRALQYRLDLLSANGDAYPLVRRIEVLLK